VYFVQSVWVLLQLIAYRDKKVVGVFVRFFVRRFITDYIVKSTRTQRSYKIQRNYKAGSGS
jgi:hypothetical protein